MGPTASAPAAVAAASTAFNGAKRGSIDAAAVAAEDVPETDKKDSQEAEAAIIVRGKERLRREFYSFWRRGFFCLVDWVDVIKFHHSESRHWLKIRTWGIPLAGGPLL